VIGFHCLSPSFHSNAFFIQQLGGVGGRQFVVIEEPGDGLPQWMLDLGVSSVTYLDY